MQVRSCCGHLSSTPAQFALLEDGALSIAGASVDHYPTVGSTKSLEAVLSAVATRRCAPHRICSPISGPDSDLISLDSVLNALTTPLAQC